MRHRRMLRTLFLSSALLMAVSCNTNRGFQAVQSVKKTGPVSPAGQCVQGAPGCQPGDPSQLEKVVEEVSEISDQMIDLDILRKVMESESDHLQELRESLEAHLEELNEQDVTDEEEINKSMVEHFYSDPALTDASQALVDVETSVNLTTDDEGNLTFSQSTEGAEVLSATLPVDQEDSETMALADLVSQVDGQENATLIPQTNIAIRCSDESCSQVRVAHLEDGSLKDSILFIKLEEGEGNQYVPLSVGDEAPRFDVSSQLDTYEADKIQEAEGLNDSTEEEEGEASDSSEDSNSENSDGNESEDPELEETTSEEVVGDENSSNDIGYDEVPSSDVNSSGNSAAVVVEEVRGESEEPMAAQKVGQEVTPQATPAQSTDSTALVSAAIVNTADAGQNASLLDLKTISLNDLDEYQTAVLGGLDTYKAFADTPVQIDTLVDVMKEHGTYDKLQDEWVTESEAIYTALILHFADKL